MPGGSPTSRSPSRLFFGAGWASHAGHYALAIVSLTFAAIGLAAFSILIWLFVDPVKYALLVFVGTWLSVFTLGLQSLNVNQGHYLAAAVTSLGIGAGHVLLYRYMPSANWGELAGYFIGGVTGITASMWFHRRAKAWIALKLERRRAASSAKPLSAACFDEHADVGQCGRIHLDDTH
jgi:hypothetical protein